MTVSGLSPGSHSIRAVYAADGTFAESTSPAVGPQPVLASEAIVVVPSSDDVSSGQSVSFVVTVDGDPAVGPYVAAPGGVVTLVDMSTGDTLDTATVDPSGEAVFPVVHFG